VTSAKKKKGRRRKEAQPLKRAKLKWPGAEKRNKKKAKKRKKHSPKKDANHKNGGKSGEVP